MQMPSSNPLNNCSPRSEGSIKGRCRNCSAAEGASHRVFRCVVYGRLACWARWDRYLQGTARQVRPRGRSESGTIFHRVRYMRCLPVVRGWNVVRSIYSGDLFRMRPQVRLRLHVRKGDVILRPGRSETKRRRLGNASVMLDDCRSTVFRGRLLRAATSPKTILLVDDSSAFCFRCPLGATEHAIGHPAEGESRHRGTRSYTSQFDRLLSAVVRRRFADDATSNAPLPPSFLDSDAEISALEAKLAKARLVKQAGMMQELLTGRIRLV